MNTVEIKQIWRIKSKLSTLKEKDKSFTVFGSEKHKYIINTPLTNQEIEDFEKKYNIKLPLGYRLYLVEIGNGGAGPYYGLEKLSDTLFQDLDFKDPLHTLNPSLPFPYTEAWNIDFDELDEEAYEHIQDDYFDPKHANGLLSLCNYGCGVSINLVVNGAEYGYMWSDDRGSDAGIYPSCELGNEHSLNFLDWYELWLDSSLTEDFPNIIDRIVNLFRKK